MSGRLIYVLGGDIAKDAMTGKWHTLDENDCDKFGIMYDRWRVEAAAVLWRKLGYPVVVSGGESNREGVVAPVKISNVMASELTQLGVPSTAIAEDDTSFNSYQQLVSLRNFLADHETKEVFILTNEYHLPRVKAFIEYAPDLASLREAPLYFVACEDTLLAADKEKWQARIDKARAKPEWAARVALELRGAGRIAKGEYPFR